MASVMDTAAEQGGCTLLWCPPTEDPPLLGWTLHGSRLGATVLLPHTLPCSPSARSS